MKEMVGGCCVCSDDRGWAENPLVYCDGQGCTVAVHQACYGIVTVPIGNWYCRKCESQERSIKVRCELCPNKEGALKPTDNDAWAHVVCALYIPEVRFGNVTTMEPIILAQIPQERYNKTCYICEERSRSRANVGACMQCNKAGCRQQFHVTCAQGLGLLCEEASNYMENVKYCGYCHHHYTKLKKGGNVKVIPPYRPVGANDSPEGSPVKETEPTKTTSKRKLSSSKSGKTPNATGDAEIGVGGGDDVKTGVIGGLEGEGSKVGNKRRKGGSRTPPVGIPSPESSSRPSSPGSSSRQGATAVSPPVATPPIPPQHAVSKESSRQSIVVTVPLDALPNNVASIATPSPPPTNPVVPAVGSTSASSTLPSDQVPIPAKRQRSQSSDKSEKGRRWMKRNSSGKSHSPPPQSQQSSGSKSSSPGESSNSQLSSSEGKLRRPAPGPGVVVKEEKDVKIFQNGLNAPHMLGNQLNPSSVMAQKMCDTLSQEMVAHSVFTQQEPTQNNSLVGPQLHRPHHAQNRIGAWTGMPGTTNNHNTTNNNNNNNIPQSLEQLLERQWEQGSQFLMEQAQHFDIASLLSCLHQLRAENAQLEEHVTNLVQRRDHLLAVNARLAIPLVQQQHPQQQQPQVNNVAASTPPVNNAPSAVENGMATAAEQVQYQRNTPQSVPRSNSAGFPGSGQQMQPQNSVVVRASSGDQRRSSSAGSNYSNHNNPGMYSSGQQQPQSQQSQVVIRRDVISDLHHNMSSSGGGKQSQP